ncbi:hypothetical protein L3556_06125 [Candidatus Synechococcus calcipolaris G9]|uniref:Uncharacterized protein n=1 Tax=Candidatus Synechococcus calcipolaris G9 TaxID=1497997 RepID=A0ABT6EXP1_9SYNE|nr:hypothetical protein [Candidatus Synechococcus calcipolaris]MDG2990512.1 hypothetical protein [Candidatus Synechococcus calcipolaris G9]
MAIDWEMLDLEPGLELLDAAFYWWEIEPTDEARRNVPEQVKRLYESLRVHWGLETWAGLEKVAEWKEFEVKDWEARLAAGEVLSDDEMELYNQARATLPQALRRKERPPRHYVTHEQLREFADKKDKKPAFLFPEVRITQTKVLEELHPTERKTLLSIIKRFLELQHIDIDQREATTKFMALTGISENTARKYLNQIKELE